MVSINLSCLDEIVKLEKYNIIIEISLINA